VQLKQAQLEFDRTTYLFKEKIKTQNDLDQVEINLELAKATLKATQSSLERARINLTYASIYSPIDGVVIARNIDVGQTVAASFQAPVLFLIANNLKKMQILANVDEADIGQIKDGQAVRFTVQSFPNDKFSGTVTQIRMQPTTAQNVVTYTVVVQVDNSGGKLLPGMTATIDFLVGQAHDVLLVANAALRIKPTPAMLTELRKMFQARPGQGAGQSSPNPGSGGNPNNDQVERRANGFGNGQFQRPKDVALLWYLDKDGQLKATRVHIGISDGQMTAIISGDVREGMEVIKTMRNELSADSTSTQRQGTPRRVMMF
jgi:HlyD family secretion protein